MDSGFWVFATVCRVFSAVETLKSKSSIVAVNVASLPLQQISETTVFFSLFVSTCKPAGAVKLSGETALAMASAFFWSAYSSLIVASKLFTLQLSPNQLICGFYKSLNFVQRHLCSSCDIVPASFAAVSLRSQSHHVAEVDAFA